MQNDTLYNKIMSIKFDVFFDVDDPPYIKYASVKPSFFLSNDMLDPNTYHLVFIRSVDIGSNPGGCLTQCGNVFIAYNNSNTEITDIVIGMTNWPFLIVGDISTDEWTLEND